MSLRPKIGFVGSMNAMPMAYALKFRRDGYDVRYVVEAEPSNILMRPEHHYPDEVPYPYPDWIVELRRPNTLLRHATAPLAYRDVLTAMADRDVVFLNDYGIALGAFFGPATIAVALSSGSDVDVYGRWAMAAQLTKGTRRAWLMPIRFVLETMRVAFQRLGMKRCQVACYFPRGLNPLGDEVLAGMARHGALQQLVERYDVNFASTGVARAPIPERALTRVFVPVRVCLNPPPGNEFEYKGNDLIIQALARFANRHPKLEIHLARKGPAADVQQLEGLIRELKLESRVTWHSEMPLRELLKLYEDSDIVFDQVGRHWMGATGCYALYMGRPLIANARLDVFGRLWPQDHPILDASTVDGIYAQLLRCEDLAFRRDVAQRGRDFAARHLDTESVYQSLRKTVDDTWRRAGPPSRRDAPSCTND